VQLLPTKLVGVIASHGDFPIERIAVDMGGEGRWVGSVGHDEVLKMTDLKEVFKDDDEGSENGDGEGEEVEAVEELEAGSVKEDEVVSAGEESADGSDSDAPKQKKRKRKERYAMPRATKKGRNEPEVEPSFFSGL
jgi:WD repeat-containing protein 55